MADANPAPTPDPVQAVDPPPDLCIFCFRDWCQDQAAKVQMSPTDYSKYMRIKENFASTVFSYKKFRRQLRRLYQHPHTQNRHLEPYWVVFRRVYNQKIPVENDPLLFYPIELCRRLNIIPGFDFFADPEQADRIRELNSKEADSINAQIRLDLEGHRLSKAKGNAPELQQVTLEGAAVNNVETQKDTPRKNYVVNPGIKLIRAVDPPPDLCIFCFRDWCQEQAGKVHMSPTDYSKYMRITRNFSNNVNPYNQFRVHMKYFLEVPEKGYRHLLPYWDIFHNSYIQKMAVEVDPLFFYPIDLCRRLNIIPGFDFFKDLEQANRIRGHNSETAALINGEIRHAFQAQRFEKNYQKNDPYRNRKTPVLEQAPLEGVAETSNYIVNLGINSIQLRPTAGHQTFMPGVNPVPTPDPVQATGHPPEGRPDFCIPCFRDWCQGQAARVHMSPRDYSKYMQITRRFSNDVIPYRKFRLQMRNLLQRPNTQNRRLQPYWDIFDRGYIEKIRVEDDPLYFFPFELCRRLNIIAGFDFFADPELANRIRGRYSETVSMMNREFREAYRTYRRFKVIQPIRTGSRTGHPRRCCG